MAPYQTIPPSSLAAHLLQIFKTETPEIAVGASRLRTPPFDHLLAARIWTLGELKLETPDAETLNAALGVITEINNISSSSKDDQDDQNLNSGTRAWRLVNTADDVEQVLSPFHSVEKNEVVRNFKLNA
ncbi:hypothetical protein C8J57DRAFT_1520925 [Mycena rebaudengoi]|nr:hypothetical protein C8J57DRAFT_1520925 [Mycena rebaudengoi]